MRSSDLNNLLRDRVIVVATRCHSPHCRHLHCRLNHPYNPLVLLLQRGNDEDGGAPAQCTITPCDHTHPCRRFTHRSGNRHHSGNRATRCRRYTDPAGSNNFATCLVAATRRRYIPLTMLCPAPLTRMIQGMPPSTSNSEA